MHEGGTQLVVVDRQARPTKSQTSSGEVIARATNLQNISQAVKQSPTPAAQRGGMCGVLLEVIKYLLHAVVWLSPLWKQSEYANSHGETS